MKCRIAFSKCVQKDLLGLEACQQIKCQDRDCANCDSECTKASSIVIASEAERREAVAEEAEEREAISENNSNDDIELADGMNPLFVPSCPKYCVGNRQACLEKGGSVAQCNRQGCNGMCLRMCGWCEAFKAPTPRPPFIET
ncbi:hypothetical protein P171DRAFT_136338 [Karstenula rhodostoma CBS 690.94]|uniref:Uncharacterized protein n=1 Tax=Karstenula rhodostoma CBS 690.94 TaxID=1392251 RepID=A0A9P4UIF0_9PLEO|nr:hypothetical protein P171DRAFT_136338 [Karstenula rhodostoma CBS 690.94]